MSRYVLLRIEDDTEADWLLEDITRYPHQPLLTPSQENPVMVEIVPDLDPSDSVARRNAGTPLTDDDRARGLRQVLRATYKRAGILAAEAEAADL